MTFLGRGWVGASGSFGGFAIPPEMGLFVRVYGGNGYSSGFSIFIGLTIVSLILDYILRQAHNNKALQPGTIASSQAAIDYSVWK